MSSVRGFRHVRRSDVVDLVTQGSLVEGSTHDYIDKCAYYGVAPDAGVLSCLRYGLRCLRPDRRLKAIDILALADTLGRNPHIVELDFSGCFMGSTGARILVEVLSLNKHIELLNLSGNAIHQAGVEAICKYLVDEKDTASLHDLRICDNRIGHKGFAAISKAIRLNRTLTYLDMSRNNLPSCSIRKVEEIIDDRFENKFPQLTVINEGNFNLTELMNSVTHGSGFVAAFLASALLLRSVSHMPYSYSISTLIYCWSLCTMFLSSTLYHSFFKLRYARRVFKALDHIAIYLLIAGTYTPFCTVGLKHDPVFGITLLFMIWAFCIVGITVSIYADRSDSKRFGLISNSLYLGMGWAAVAAGRSFVDRVPMISLQFVMLGGVFYTVGVYFVVTGSRTPQHHTIWHILVMKAAASHFIAVCYLLHQ